MKGNQNSIRQELFEPFLKSGVHSALQHDAIVDGGEADYAIVETEANEVAKAAVRAMKNSRYVRSQDIIYFSFY